MKKYIFFALLTFLIVAGAHAQSIPVSANIPFDFVVGNTTMHQGEYTMLPLSGTNDVVQLRRADLTQSILFQPSGRPSESTPVSEGKLIFIKEGSRYYLWQVWTAGYSRGRELPVKFSEKEQASVTDQSTTVIYASLGQ